MGNKRSRAPDLSPYYFMISQMDQKAKQTLENHRDQNRVLEILHAIAARGDQVRNPSAFFVKEIHRDPGDAPHSVAASQSGAFRKRDSQSGDPLQPYSDLINGLDEKTTGLLRGHHDQNRVVEVLEAIS